MSDLLHSLKNKRALLVASTGGHLAQLEKLRRRMELSEDSTWVTFRSPQSESLLAGQRVDYVDYIAPRDWRTAAKVTRDVRRVLRAGRFDVAISTGAALAVAALPIARLSGCRSVYIESVSRFEGPSLSGRILSRTPGIETYNQHSRWASRRWKNEFSVLDSYSTAASHSASGSPMRVFVTLGTIRPYRFDALVDRLAEMSGISFRWQLGTTVRNDLPGEMHEYLSAGEFAEAISWADVVVSHSGVGTALQLLDDGVVPVLVPRRSVRGEHVDDHQEQVAKFLSSRGLAVAAEAPSLTIDDLLSAASRRVLSD